MKNTEKSMEKIVAFCKGRGYVYAGSEIYGGLANTWDYGPLGVELKNNVKKAWWRKFVQENPYNVGLDSAILMNPQTWVASGHLGGFSDPLMDCKSCKTRHRADKLIEDYVAEHYVSPSLNQIADYFGVTVTGNRGGSTGVPNPDADIDYSWIHKSGEPIYYKANAGTETYEK